MIRLQEMSLRNVLILQFLFRLPFLLFPIVFNEQMGFLAYGSILYNGDLPYLTYMDPAYNVLGEIRILPPLFYYVAFLLLLCSGNNAIVLGYVTKLVWNLCELGVIGMVYKIALEFVSEQKAKIIAFLYGISPISLFLGGYLGLEESLSQLLSLLAFYYFIKKRYSISAVFLGLAISEKLMPVLYLCVFLPYFFRTKQIKRVFLYVCILPAIYLGLCLPYMIHLPALLQAHVMMAKRLSSISYLSATLSNILNVPAILILSIDLVISMKTLITLVGTAVLFGFFLLKKPLQRDLLKYMVLLYTILPLLTFSAHLRYFYWLSPYLLMCIMFYCTHDLDFNSLNQFLTRTSFLTTICGLLTLIYHYVLWSDYSALNLDSGGTQLYYLTLGYACYLMIWGLWNLAQRSFSPFQRWYLILEVLYGIAFILAFQVELYRIPDRYNYFTLGLLILGTIFIFWQSRVQFRTQNLLQMTLKTNPMEGPFH